LKAKNKEKVNNSPKINVPNSPQIYLHVNAKSKNVFKKYNNNTIDTNANYNRNIPKKRKDLTSIDIANNNNNANYIQRKNIASPYVNHKYSHNTYDTYHPENLSKTINKKTTFSP
jgi:hypothetical protein